MYIDIVKALLRVEARERPSVYRLLARADVAQFRRELAESPIRTCSSPCCHSAVRCAFLLTSRAEGDVALDKLLHSRSFHFEGKGTWVTISTGDISNHYATCVVVSHSEGFDITHGCASVCSGDPRVLHVQQRQRSVGGHRRTLLPF